jgi:hypothetical protein
MTATYAGAYVPTPSNRVFRRICCKKNTRLPETLRYLRDSRLHAAITEPAPLVLFEIRHIQSGGICFALPEWSTCMMQPQLSEYRNVHVCEGYG